MTEGKPSAWKVEYMATAERQFRKLDRTVQRRIGAAVDALAANPGPAGATALTNRPGQLRVKVGDYRVVYMVQDHSSLYS